MPIGQLELLQFMVDEILGSYAPGPGAKFLDFDSHYEEGNVPPDDF